MITTKRQLARVVAIYVASLTVGIVLATILGASLAPAKANAAPASQWNGCYVGGGGSYSMLDGKTSFGNTAVGDVLSVDGLGMQGWGLYGKVGCDIELLPKVVVGAWGNYDWHDSTDFTVAALGMGDVLKASMKDDWAVGGRVGYAIHPDVLPYFLLGYTQGKFSSVTSSLGNVGINLGTLDGYVLGAGVDIALGRGWYSQAEYSYAKYSSRTYDLGGGDYLKFEPDVSTFRVGLAYKFNFGGVDTPPLK